MSPLSTANSSPPAAGFGVCAFCQQFFLAVLTYRLCPALCPFLCLFGTAESLTLTSLARVKSTYGYAFLDHSNAVGWWPSRPSCRAADFSGFAPAKSLLTHSPRGPQLGVVFRDPVVSFPPWMGSFSPCLPGCSLPPAELVPCGFTMRCATTFPPTDCTVHGAPFPVFHLVYDDGIFECDVANAD